MANNTKNKQLFYIGIIMPALLLVIVFVIFIVAWFKCKLRERVLHQKPKCLKCRRDSRLVLCGPNSNFSFDHIDSDETPKLENEEGYVALFIPSTSESNKDIKSEYTGSWLVMRKYDIYGYLQPRMYLQKEHVQLLSAQLLQNTVPNTDIQVQLENVDNLRLSVGSTSSDHGNRLGFRNINNNTELRPSLGLTRPSLGLTCSARAKANRYITDRSTTDRTVHHISNHGNHVYSSVSSPPNKAQMSPHRYINDRPVISDKPASCDQQHSVMMTCDHWTSHDDYYSNGLDRYQSDV